PDPVSPRAAPPLSLHPSPTRRSSDLQASARRCGTGSRKRYGPTSSDSPEPPRRSWPTAPASRPPKRKRRVTSRDSARCGVSGRLDRKEHTSELQSPDHLVCRLLLEKK